MNVENPEVGRFTKNKTKKGTKRKEKKRKNKEGELR